MQGLFIIDFDLTIPSQHTHNILLEAMMRGKFRNSDNQSAWQLVKDVPATGSEEKWREVLMSLIDKGHHVAIASFSDYPQIIKRYLQEKINLPTRYLDKIFIESWLPQNPMIASKNEHIQNVMHHFNYNNPHGIVLIDDAKYNCEAAAQQNWQTIEVISGDRSGAHLDKILLIAKNFEPL